jgi:hypothetical protein
MEEILFIFHFSYCPSYYLKVTILGHHLPTEVNPMILAGTFLELVVTESATSQATIKIPAYDVILPAFSPPTVACDGRGNKESLFTSI